MPISAAHQPATPRRRSSIALDSDWLLLGVLGVPAVVFYFGLSTSYAAGTMIVAFWLLAIQPSATWLRRYGLRPTGRNRTQLASLGLLILVLVHFGVAAGVGQVSVARGLASLLPLLLMILAGAALADALLAVPDRHFHRGMLRVFGLMCVLALVGSLGLGPPTLAEDWRKPVFPFSEPSHFALSFVPVLMYVVASTRGLTRVALVIAGLGCSVLIQNLTLMFGVLLVALVALPLHVLALLGVPLAFGALSLDMSYFTERLDFSDETSNLSTLVFLQGWQMVEEALAKSHGLGLGFQQLGVFGTDVPASELIRLMRDGEDSNLLDGGFLFAKLGGELGLIGVCLAVFLLVLAVRSGAWLRQVAAGGRATRPMLILAHSSVFTFIVELFVRSTAYFSGTALLFVASLWLLRSQRSRRRSRRSIPAAPRRPSHIEFRLVPDRTLESR